MNDTTQIRLTPNCCRFHACGGTHELICGGDTPNEGGKHSQTCAYFAGGDCTCGHTAPDFDEPTEEVVLAVLAADEIRGEEPDPNSIPF